jgi:formylglycine-generating enzyme required for sulfatase activity
MTKEIEYAIRGSSWLYAIRGSSWLISAWTCHSVLRLRDKPGLRDYDLGFRPAFRLKKVKR